jgi:hypothetical protein
MTGREARRVRSISLLTDCSVIGLRQYASQAFIARRMPQPAEPRRIRGAVSCDAPARPRAA